MPGKRRIDLRLATQILLLQLAVVGVTLGIAFALLAVVYHQRLIGEYGHRSLDIARVLAAAPAVRADVAMYDGEVPSAGELAGGPLQNIAAKVRAGTGGDEAAIFAADLTRMYQRYAEARGWGFEIMSLSENDVGGYKEASATITGRGVFERMKFESGVHRVQRVPVTESSGRIHTSTATVAVLPEAEEVDIKIEEKDIRVDVYRSSGPGGQSVNTTDSAVRITHLETGIVVTQQDEKSQHKNRAKAMKILRARLYDAERYARDSERAAARRNQIGSGDRSERIRTYNFPQNRVTDHRINLTLHKLDRILIGEGLDEMIDALSSEDQAQRLSDLDDGNVRS